MPFENCEALVSASSSLLGAVIGAAAAIGASFFAEHLKRQADVRSDRHSYLAHLKFAHFEISNCQIKASNLRNHVEGLRQKTGRIPLLGLQTFEILPELLERSKIWMAEHGKSLQLVTQVSDCHFEFCRLRNGLEIGKIRGNSIGVAEPTYTELKPYLDHMIYLLDSAEKEFLKAVQSLDAEIEIFEPKF